MMKAGANGEKDRKGPAYAGPLFDLIAASRITLALNLGNLLDLERVAI